MSENIPHPTKGIDVIDALLKAIKEYTERLDRVEQSIRFLKALLAVQIGGTADSATVLFQKMVEQEEELAQLRDPPAVGEMIDVVRHLLRKPTSGSDA